VISKLSPSWSVIENRSLRERTALLEEIRWMISIRWVAVGAIITGTLIGTYFFPILPVAFPLYICAGILFVCNIGFFFVTTRKWFARGYHDIAFAMVQAETDLVVLTGVLFFSGGVTNPFFLFYIFHVITITIILPKNLSFVVGLTAIALFGILAINDLNAGALLGHHPLALSTTGGFWRNPVYVLAAFVAFACTVVVSQYLTSVIITRMTAKEIEAARNSDLLKAIINAMAEGLIFINRQGNVTMCNPAAERWKVNFPPNDSQNNKSLDNFPRALVEHVRTLLAEGGTKPNKPNLIEFTTTGPFVRYVEATSCPVNGVDGVMLGHVIVGQDMTEHKRLEADLLKRTEEITGINEELKMSRLTMAQREKMVALGQMAAGIAHEIGNPLASLSSVAQYLGRKTKHGQDRELFSSIQHQVDRISNILKRMLGLSRPVTAEYKWVDLNDLINDTLSLIKFDKRAKGIEIKNEQNHNLPMVWLNPQNFEQMLLNIVINAMDAMEPKKESGESLILEIDRAYKGEMLNINVRDTGIGMSPEVCQRAFESFFTTKEISKGTGLGLFISYNLAKEVNGMIELKSKPGIGTTVTIKIPVRPKSDLIAGITEDSDPSNRGQLGD